MDEKAVRRSGIQDLPQRVKKRFARIKAGNIDDDAFKRWSKKAREEKKKCDNGTITLEEFKQWLAESE